MAAATNSDQQVVLAGKLNGADDIKGAQAARNERRALIDHSVPNFSRGIEGCITRKN